MKRKEIRIAVMVSSEKLKQEIREFAKKEDRTMSNLLLRAFRHYKRTMEQR